MATGWEAKGYWRYHDCHEGGYSGPILPRNYMAKHGNGFREVLVLTSFETAVSDSTGRQPFAALTRYIFELRKQPRDGSREQPQCDCRTLAHPQSGSQQYLVQHPHSASPG